MMPTFISVIEVDTYDSVGGSFDSSKLMLFRGMAGAVYIKGVAVTKYKRSAVKDTDEWPSKYSKLFVEHGKLDDGLEFSFTDKRRFAKVRLLDNPVSVPPISELGPDALTEPMTVDEFCSSLSKKKIGIKALLLDQLNKLTEHRRESIHCKLLPASPKKAVNLAQVTNIAVKVDADSLRFPVEWLFHFRWGKNQDKLMVIEKAIEVGADSSQFPSNWIFHSGKRSLARLLLMVWPLTCDVLFPVLQLFFNSPLTLLIKTTAYVPELQKLTGNQAVKEAAKPSKGTTSGKGDSDDGSGNEDEPTKPKVVKGKNATKPKKAPSKEKTSASVEEDDDDEDDNSAAGDVSSKRTRGAKKPPAKSKPKGRSLKRWRRSKETN
ncbi:hypothetical protein DH2020_018737 [Rehmannia glutinosa]|uniref:Uncharacterized protein n=1 Tax=Rehmannia glutinosa TaxID=99300 RepID=A0ABR0WP78_REHGL